MCTFYYRLTKDLDGYRSKIYFGFGFIITSWVAVQLNILLSCRPSFSMWWQIYPDPGEFCHPAISPSIVWTGLALNVATDLYLIMIPMPMLWKAAMPWVQKFWLIALFSCGLFVTMAAILRVVLLVSVCSSNAPPSQWLVLTTSSRTLSTVPCSLAHGQFARHSLPSSLPTSLCSSHTSRRRLARSSPAWDPPLASLETAGLAERELASPMEHSTPGGARTTDTALSRYAETLCRVIDRAITRARHS